MLNPYPGEKMNAYPINNRIKNPSINDKSLLTPVGDRIEKEFDVKTSSSWELQGMGSSKSFSYDKANAFGK